MTLEIAQNFLIALLIGALVGVEREKSRTQAPGQAFGGLQTYILTALAGAASAWLSVTVPQFAWVFGATLGVVGVTVVASYLRRRHQGADDTSLVSEMSAVAVFLISAMAVLGHSALAVALAVAITAVLAFRTPLHNAVQRIGTRDLYAGIELLVASFIVLPLLPNDAIDPWGAINPAQLWLLVIMISALSLVGYVAVRWLGAARGTAVTGIAGGLVSSTATTLSFARSSRADSSTDGGHALAAGILLAWAVMFARMLTLTALINWPLLRATWLPFFAMGVATVGFALWHFVRGLRQGRSVAGQPVQVSNPFGLAAAIRFGLLFAVVLLIVKLAQAHAPEVGLYVVSALAGLVDVDAITLSMASSAKDASAWSQAGLALAIAALVNTLSKCAMVLALGSGPARWHIGIATVAIVLAGAVGMWVNG